MRESLEAYATLFFAVYDGRCRRLRDVNCGHPPALLLRPDGALERLGATAGAIGLFEPWDCTMAECQLHEGDTLAIYSDGVTEALSETGEEFGDERLERALVATRDRSAQAGLDGVLAEVQKFSGPNQYDDITLIVCHVTASAPPVAGTSVSHVSRQ